MTTRATSIVLTSFFLIAISSVPITQAILDLKDGEKPQALELFEKAPTAEHLRAFEDELERHSYFVNLIRPAFQLLRYFATRDLGEKAVRGPGGWYFYAPDVKYLTEPYVRDLPSGAPQVDDPLPAIRDLARDLAARGIELLVVPVPTKGAIYPDRVTSRVAAETEVAVNTRRFVADLRQAGIDVVVLHDAFRARRRTNSGEALFMATDTHWTCAGAQLAAEVIAARVATRPWFRALARPPRYQRTPVTLRRWGDILKMTRIPAQEALFSGELVTCRKVFDTKRGAAYEDDPKSPILLLGDSYSRIFHTDEPEAAGLVASLAYDLQLPLATIINDGGASTLVRQQLAKQPEALAGKRLVIWEFTERDIRFGMKGWQRIPLQAAPGQ